jgi:hypothetical protein
LAIDDDLTFDDISDPDDLSASDKPANATGSVFQEDLTALTIKLVPLYFDLIYSLVYLFLFRKLPATCEVANPANQDSYLLNRGYYNSLPNLQYVINFQVY